MEVRGPQISIRAGHDVSGDDAARPEWKHLELLGRDIKSHESRTQLHGKPKRAIRADGETVRAGKWCTRRRWKIEQEDIAIDGDAAQCLLASREPYVPVR